MWKILPKRIICLVICSFCYAVTVEAQEPHVSFEKMMVLTLSNPLDIARQSEPIFIPLATLTEQMPDFNWRSFRLRDPDALFEPADIPSQIRMLPGRGEAEDALSFQLSFAPNQKRKIELWYNPSGVDEIEYPAKTQSSDTWYRPASTLIWENEKVAYRSYNGIVDYFAKTYPHLRLHNLMNESYHNEQLWGLDPYLVGDKPGLGGVLLIEGDRITHCYGATGNSVRSYIMRAFDGGPVCAGGIVDVIGQRENLLSITYELSADRFDNHVHAKHYSESENVLIAPGMQKFDNSRVILDENAGFMIGWGIPVESYGTIGTALVWNPDDARGMYETEHGMYVKLFPDSDGVVAYRSMAIWHRATGPQPDDPDAFAMYVGNAAKCNENPIIVEF